MKGVTLPQWKTSLNWLPPKWSQPSKFDVDPSGTSRGTLAVGEMPTDSSVKRKRHIALGSYYSHLGIKLGFQIVSLHNSVSIYRQDHFKSIFWLYFFFVIVF